MALRLSTGVQNRLAGINTNYVTLGDFEVADVSSAWSKKSGDTITLAGATASGATALCLKATAGASPDYCYQTIATANVQVGQLYMIDYYFKKDGAGGGSVTVGNAAGNASYYDSGTLTDSSWTRRRAVFIPTTTAVVINLNVLTSGQFQYFDEVKLYNLSHSLQDMFNGAQFEIYTGTQPSDPDSATSGTLLVTIKNGGSGVTFADATDGLMTKTVGETWSGTTVATGTAGWFRLRLANEAAGSSTTAVRMDGSVATSGGQLRFSSLSFTAGATQTIDNFQPQVPMG